MVKLAEIVGALGAACPASLAAEWDNVGLHVGDPARDIARIMIALDADLPTIEIAVSRGVDLLVTHHPLFRDGPRRVTDDDPDGRRLTAAIRAKLAVFSLHTNFDADQGGVSDVLAECLGLSDTRVLVAGGKMRKIVVFVPEEHVESVFLAMTDAGAGRIGVYRECSFRVAGTGTFTAPADSHPALGKAGRANAVDEIRLETTVPGEALGRVVEAMVAAHPYEEVAYDVYALESTRPDVGLGRIGNTVPASLEEFAASCAKKLGVATAKWAGAADSTVRTVAVCGGSGGSLIGAAVAKGADVLVCGDVRYHDAQRALASGLALVDAGHDGTEAPAVGALAKLVEDAAKAVGYTGEVTIQEQPELWRPAGG